MSLLRSFRNWNEALLEAGFRVLSFLVLGIALLVISLLYTRSRKQLSENEVGVKH